LAIGTFHENVPIAECTVITPDDGHRRCPQHIEFRDEINSGYLVHLVGYFIRRILQNCLTSASNTIYNSSYNDWEKNKEKLVLQRPDTKIIQNPIVIITERKIDENYCYNGRQEYNIQQLW
jgi:hypothetical protein